MYSQIHDDVEQVSKEIETSKATHSAGPKKKRNELQRLLRTTHYASKTQKAPMLLISNTFFGVLRKVKPRLTF
jgi:hypothetical protein